MLNYFLTSTLGTCFLRFSKRYWRVHGLSPIRPHLIYTRVRARKRNNQSPFVQQTKTYHTKPCCLSTFNSASDMASLAALV